MTIPMMMAGASGPSLFLDATTGALDPRLQVARAAGGATYFDRTGTLQMAAVNTPRIDYGAAGGTAALGLLIEESRTNSIRNPRAEGAVVGTPGTLPTNWRQSQSSGLVPNVIGFGSESGIPYVDLQLTGTAVSGQNNVFFETGTGVAALTGQTWDVSAYVKLVAGTLTNVTGPFVLSLNETTSAGAGVVSGMVVSLPTPTGAGLSSQRTDGTRTLSGGATVAAVQPFIQFNLLAGAVNFTLRIGAAQLELGAFATSPTLPAIGTPAATFRDADQITLPIGMLGNLAAFTIVAEANLPVLPAAGGFQGLFHIDDGTTGNRIELYRSSGSNAVLGLLSSGYNPGLGTLTPSTPFKAGIAVTAGAQKAAMNGTVAVAGSSAMPPGLANFRLGQASVGGLYANGYIRRLRYWPRVLSTPELTVVTT